jgi:hypothetical protein
MLMLARTLGPDVMSDCRGGCDQDGAVTYVGYDRGAIRFAIWVGRGRDPNVAYLDATQLVVTTTELTTRGLLLYATGASSNILGGIRKGPIDRGIRHRIAHGMADAEGAPWFVVDGAADACVPTDGLCDLALPDPVLDLPFQEKGSFHLDADFALQWALWQDPLRAGVVRHAVYLDAGSLLESAPGADGRPRIWPAWTLGSHDLELVTPSALEAAIIEERIARTTGSGS